MPTVVQQFPGELLPGARPVAERLFTDIRSWRAADAGGYSGAWAAPGRVRVRRAGGRRPRVSQEMGAGASSATSSPTGRGRPYR